MIGKIIYISGNYAHVKPNPDMVIASDLINMLVIFEDDKKKIAGEILDIDNETIRIKFLGEFFDNGKFISGVLRKPNLNSTIRKIENNELEILLGIKNEESLFLGKSPVYDDVKINVNVNQFFSNHFAIFGNSGSGKSFGLTRLLQNLYHSPDNLAVKSNLLIFDASGEYHNAFRNINQINPNINFKVFSTIENNPNGDELIKIPLWLLSIDDFALLLDVDSHAQLSIIEKMLKTVAIFSQDDELTNRYKNHLIASALLSVLYSSETPTKIRNSIFSIVSTCSTPEFNLNVQIPGIGYTRSFRKCFEIEKTGGFAEGILISNYIMSFVDESLDTYKVKYGNYFTLEDLETALNFTLISEGLLDNDKTYHEAIMLKVRLHAITTGPYAKFFRFDKQISISQFISSVLLTKDNKRAQLINFNIDDIDARFSKILVKIYSKLFFDFSKNMPNRASVPFHIILEEAHRYVQNDNDRFLLGYNIFDRIAKEGRKYGVILSVVTQRPTELNETVISQCSNFLIFKMNHPSDVDYMSKMVPNISEDIIEKQKNLQPGTCIAFGSAFKISTLISFALPNPEPLSSNCNVFAIWKGAPLMQPDNFASENQANYAQYVKEPVAYIDETPVNSLPPMTNEEPVAEDMINEEVDITSTIIENPTEVLKPVNINDAAPKSGISFINRDDEELFNPDSGIY